MLRLIVPQIVKQRQDLFAKDELWQGIEAPSYGGTLRALRAIINYMGALEIGFERPPTQNGEDPAQWS